MRSGTRNLRAWTAWYLRARRRARQHGLLPAPVLRAVYPSLLAWDWNLANPFKWNIWMSTNGGVSWTWLEDYWQFGAARSFAPDGGSQLYYLVGVDAGGREVTEHSNVVRPDDAIAPPVITLATEWWENTTPGWFDVELTWTFVHGIWPAATMEIFCGVDGGAAVLVGTTASNAPGWLHVMVTQAESALLYTVRYRHGFDIGPFSAAYPVQLSV